MGAAAAALPSWSWGRPQGRAGGWHEGGRICGGESCRLSWGGRGRPAYGPQAPTTLSLPENRPRRPDCPSEIGWGLALDFRATPGASGWGMRGSLDPTEEPGPREASGGLGPHSSGQSWVMSQSCFAPHAPRGLGQNILEMYVLRPPTLKPVQAGQEAPGRHRLTPGPHPGLPPTR